MAKTASMSFSLSSSSQKLTFFAVLMYALYGHPGYFKFKRKYQQYGPYFQTISPFLMIMMTPNGNNYYNITNVPTTLYLSQMKRFLTHTTAFNFHKFDSTSRPTKCTISMRMEVSFLFGALGRICGENL